MITIRLRRAGKKNKPFFHIVLTEDSYPLKGKYIEKLGYFDPISIKKEINIERINYWIKIGAKTSKRVQSIINKKGN